MNPRATKLRLIDTHHHFLPPSYVTAVGEAPIAAGLAVPKWSPQDSIEAMDRAGIETAVVSITNPGIAVDGREQRQSLARECNNFARTMALDHPGRFDAFAALPMPDLEVTLTEVKYALEDLKLAGIGLLTNYHGVYLGDPSFDPLFRELHRRKAVVFVHPAVPTYSPLDHLVSPAVVEFPHQTTRAIVSLLYNGVFARYSDINFIFAHAGGTVPFICSRLQTKKDPVGNDPITILKRLHYDLALSANAISFPALLSFAGAARIVFGSDYPFAPEQRLTEAVDYLGRLAHENTDFPIIERGNALALMPSLVDEKYRAPSSRLP
jgi:predicted TIM-barrel fold metal-dependent hydrolase